MGKKSKNPYYTELRKEYPRTWRIWNRMNYRCEKNQPYYVETKVCDEWSKELSQEEGFITFVDDMGPCEDTALSIDRINYLGDYEPGNCRWTDWKTQQNNKAFFKETERGKWAKVADSNGISRGQFYARVQRGWSLEDASSLPYNSTHYRNRKC